MIDSYLELKKVSKSFPAFKLNNISFSCPISDIRLKNGKPIWLRRKCMQCCACINRCPVSAIQYGTSTRNGGRYVFPD